MADLEKTIAIIFSGVDELSGPLTGMSKGLNTFSRDITNMGAPLDAAAMAVLKINAALVTMAGGGLLYAFNQSKNYEQAVIELQKVMGEGETITKEMEDQFTSLSREYGVSTTSIIGGLAELRQSGFDTAEGMGVLDTSLMLSRASELSVEESTNLLKRTLIGYKLEVKDATDLGDLWNHTSQVGNTNVLKLAEAFAIVSRQTHDAGFSIEQTAAILTPVIGVFDSGSEAGIAFSTALSRIIDPTKKGEEAIRFLTGATGPLNEEFATGKDVFEAVARGLQEVDTQTGLVKVAQIVGVQQAKRIKVAFDDYFLTLEAIGPAADRYMSLQKEVDLQNASAAASVDKLKKSFGELAIAIGNEFRAAAVEAIAGGTSIERALEDIVKGGTFDPIFAALREFASDIGAFLEQVADDLPKALAGVDFSGFLSALGNVGGAIEGMFQGVNLSTPEGLRKAIQDVIDTFESLANISVGIFESLALISNSIITLIKVFNELDPDAKKLVGNILGLGTAMVTLGGVVGVAGILLGGLSSFSLLLAPGGAIVTGIGAIVGLLLGPAGLVLALGAAGAALIKFADIDVINAMASDIASDFKHIGDASEDNLSKTSLALLHAGDSAKVTADEVKKIGPEIELIPSHKITDFSAEKDQGTFDAINAEIEILAEDKTTEVTPKVKPGAVTDTNKKLDEIDQQKMVEIQLKGDIEARLAEIKGAFDVTLAGIEARAETVQTAFEWTAKVDIAEIEAGAKVAAAAFASVAESVSATASASAEMFSAFIGSMNELSFVDKFQMMAILKEQMAMEQQALNIQRDLTEAQIAYMQAKADALRAGDGLIKISSEGLEPALEMIMFQILEKVQLRVTEEAGEFLLGLGVT